MATKSYTTQLHSSLKGMRRSFVLWMAEAAWSSSNHLIRLDAHFMKVLCCRSAYERVPRKGDFIYRNINCFSAEKDYPIFTHPCSLTTTLTLFVVTTRYLRGPVDLSLLPTHFATFFGATKQWTIARHRFRREIYDCDHIKCGIVNLLPKQFG